MTMLQANSTTVAARLGETRRMAGLSVRAIAPLIGVGHATISRWENGLAEPSITQFALWAAATKQPLDRMIEGLDWCTPRDLNPEPTDSEFWSIVAGLASIGGHSNIGDGFGVSSPAGDQVQYAETAPYVRMSHEAQSR